jgi:ferredoxin
MRVKVDPTQCGCTGYCARLAPAVFIQEQGKEARAIAGEVPEAFADLVREAASLCPTNAIAIED